MDKKEELKDKRKKIIAGLEATYKKLVDFKRYKNSPLVVTKNGEISEIAPENIWPTTTYVNSSNKI